MKQSSGKVSNEQMQLRRPSSQISNRQSSHLTPAPAVKQSHLFVKPGSARDNSHKTKGASKDASVNISGSSAAATANVFSNKRRSTRKSQDQSNLHDLLAAQHSKLSLIGPTNSSQRSVIQTIVPATKANKKSTSPMIARDSQLMQPTSGLQQQSHQMMHGSASTSKLMPGVVTHRM